jgi:hypothetical protein
LKPLIRSLPGAESEYLEAKLRHNTENLLKLALGGSFKAGVVAGDEFEPTTFGL